MNSLVNGAWTIPVGVYCRVKGAIFRYSMYTVTVDFLVEVTLEIRLRGVPSMGTGRRRYKSTTII